MIYPQGEAATVVVTNVGTIIIGSLVVLATNKEVTLVLVLRRYPLELLAEL